MIPGYLGRPLENPIRDAIRETLIAMGHWCEVNGVSSSGDIRKTGFGAGSPDLLVILRTSNRAVWLEVKRDAKEKLRPAQKKWHDSALARGLHVHTIWSVSMAVNLVNQHIE